MMTDLEMTRLCAEAMGYKVRGPFTADPQYGVETDEQPAHAFGDTDFGRYDPLHDDAQAMALVKKFGLSLWEVPGDQWYVRKEAPSHTEYLAGQNNWSAYSESLNRAIVECVAKMQKEKTK